MDLSYSVRQSDRKFIDGLKRVSGVKSIRREIYGRPWSDFVIERRLDNHDCSQGIQQTIAVTYVGLGLFGRIFLIASLYGLYQAVALRLPLLLIRCAVLFSLGIGFMYVIFALHQRRNWARHAAVSFWLLCLIWTGFTIARNGLDPEPPPGPLQYSNAEQLAGARFSALVTPYFMAILESTAAYCLLTKANVVNQFKRPGQTYTKF